jgi:diguanylate cyclase (GGDEF)-like protein
MADASFQQFFEVRQQLLDTLPIAAALVATGKSGNPLVECANPIFKQYEKPFSVLDGEDRPILERGGLGDRICAFLSGIESSAEFTWSDGSPIEQRHFTVKMTRLVDTPDDKKRCMIFLLDQTAQVRTEQNLRREMLSDSLSGLPNRAGFTELLEQAVEEGGHFAVLVIDLVRFSRINECVGTIAGDELIITVARRLLKAMRVGDRLARTGGDEFGMLIRLVDGPGDALHVGRRIKQALASPFRLTDLEIRVDCSVGCAVMLDEHSDVEKLVRDAQFALKRAKETGKIEIYQPTAFHLARQRFSMETELRRAVENGHLHLAFQPLIDLSSEEVSGFEALARWEHPEHGTIGPQEFIPVAEESGLIVPLGRWALENAARTLAEWDRRAGSALPIRMSVNVSAIQLARDDMCGAVAEVLAGAGIAGNRLTLELTESAIIADPERAVRVLDGLKALDTTIAMDDFGTGYSSLAYLQRLPIDILKIDRSFITGMLSDKNKIAIVRAVLSLADALGMKTTAEGIESFELSRTLAALGCATGQGYFYSDPLDADQAYDYLVSRNR